MGQGFLIIEKLWSHPNFTIGRDPLDEWSARRIDHYLTTHNTHKRQSSMSPVGFETTNPASVRSQTHELRQSSHWDRRLYLQSEPNKLLFFIWRRKQKLISKSCRPNTVIPFHDELRYLIIVRLFWDMALKMAAVESSETTHHGITYQKSNFNIYCIKNLKCCTYYGHHFSNHKRSCLR